METIPLRGVDLAASSGSLSRTLERQPDIVLTTRSMMGNR